MTAQEIAAQASCFTCLDPAQLQAFIVSILSGSGDASAGGNMGGFTSLINISPTVTAGAYLAGDSIGGKLTLTDAFRLDRPTGVLESITILDRANQKAAMQILIFNANPTAATLTNDAPFVASTNDVNVIASVALAATDYVTVNSKAYATLKGLGITLKNAAGDRDLWAAVVAVGTPTFAAATDFHIKFGILQD